MRIGKHINVSLVDNCQICQFSSAAGIQALDWHRFDINPTGQCWVLVKTNTSDIILSFKNEKVMVNILLASIGLAEHTVLDSIK